MRKRSVFTCREKELKAFAWLDVCESVWDVQHEQGEAEARLPLLQSKRRKRYNVRMCLCPTIQYEKYEYFATPIPDVKHQLIIMITTHVMQ